MEHGLGRFETAMNDISQDRLRIANRIHDLLLHELGEDMDVSLMLGPPEYARAVLSLCRSCGNGELVRLGEQFLLASAEEARLQRLTQRPLTAAGVTATGCLPTAFGAGSQAQARA